MLWSVDEGDRSDESSDDVIVVMRRVDRSLSVSDNGAIVETRPFANVVIYGSSDRVMETTSPLASVARKTPASNVADESSLDVVKERSLSVAGDLLV